ncbi:MAG: DNA polymerase III subunit delta' [Chloroflexota bacterium]|nr:DNA polymerase III subunit delta' [Chloroflexota bacterium]
MSAATVPGWPVVGHAAAVELLHRALAHSHPAHAYLLTGPAQIGKATLARLFAQALFCQGDPLAGLADTGAAGSASAVDPQSATHEGNPTGFRNPQSAIPCGRCRACTLIARGTYPDVDWYSLARQGAEPEQLGRVNKELSISTIRSVQGSLALRPYEGRWRVAVVEDADTMSLAAANALLKTLEEPPPYAVLLLLAADANDLPPTIVSRVQLIPLRPLSRAAMAVALRAAGVAEAQATLLAAIGGGRLGWALDTAHHPERLVERSELLDLLAALPAADLPARFAFAADLAARFSADRAAVFATLTQLALWWRDLLVVRVGAADLVLNTDRRSALAATAAGLTPRQIGAFLAAVTATQQQLGQNVSPRLALESLMLAMP